MFFVETSNVFPSSVRIHDTSESETVMRPTMVLPSTSRMGLDLLGIGGL
jgi:hypothetical protein